MKRVPDWDLRLVEYASDMIGKPFVWGQTDCTTIVFKGLEVMYDYDFTKGLKWHTTLRTAVNLYKKTGGIEKVLLKKGACGIGLGFATTGDVLISPKKPLEVANSCFIVVRGQMLSNGPGKKVSLHPMSSLLPNSKCLRINYE